MNKVAIQVNHLSKRYQIGVTRTNTLREQFSSTIRHALNRTPQHGQDERSILALNDLSFELAQGEVLGVVGANGSGKSTLLKILARITRPTSGWVGINGYIGSLLGIGTGFSPELTGRENIYLNGAVLGLKQTEIARKFDEIVAFSEIEQFLDTAVKYYSSGMHVRLAFSVAIHLTTDILLIDEVLAVGDAAFRQKSMARMQQIVTEEGRTIILVSHDSNLIASLSTQCIYLKKGVLIAQGDPNSVLDEYLLDSGAKREQSPHVILVNRGNGQVTITNLQFLDAESLEPLTHVSSGQDVVIEIHYQTQDATLTIIQNVIMGLSFFNAFDHFVTLANSQMANGYFKELPASGVIYCHMPRIPLMAGQFRIAATLLVDGQIAFLTENIATISVELADFYQIGHAISGPQGVYIEQRWSTTWVNHNTRQQQVNVAEP